MKKLLRISIVLAICLSFCLCSVPAFAAGNASSDLDGLGLGTANFNGDVYVYKDPFGERVEENGKACFIAKAANATDVTWYVQSADGATAYKLDEASDTFSGLEVTYNSSKTEVYLRNVPSSMDGWKLLAKFDGQNGPVCSRAAELKVVSNVNDPLWSTINWLQINGFWDWENNCVK